MNPSQAPFPWYYSAPPQQPSYTTDGHMSPPHMYQHCYLASLLYACHSVLPLQPPHQTMYFYVSPQPQYQSTYFYVSPQPQYWYQTTYFYMSPPPPYEYQSSHPAPPPQEPHPQETRHPAPPESHSSQWTHFHTSPPHEPRRPAPPQHEQHPRKRRRESPPQKPQTYYDILGVEVSADNGEIESAFRKKARQYHPDRNPDLDATSVFLRLSEAKDVLLSPTKRSRYNFQVFGTS